MFLPFKLVCDKRVRNDGTNPILIQCCLNSQRRTLLRTCINIPIKYWKKKLCRVSDDLPKELGSYELLNERLSLLVRELEDIITVGKKNDINDLIGYVKSKFLKSEKAESKIVTNSESVSFVEQ